MRRAVGTRLLELRWSLTRRSTIAVALVLGLLLVGPGGSATGQQDAHPGSHPASVTRVIGDRLAHAGGNVEVEVRVRGPLSEGTTVKLYLSRDRRRGHDVRLKPAIKASRLAAGARVTLRADLGLPAGTKAGRYRLLACLRGRPCVASSAAMKVATLQITTSNDLISAALGAHRITRADAATDRVLAAYLDPRLPERLQGDGDGQGTVDALRGADAAWKTLSRHQRALISPHFHPPARLGPGVGATADPRPSRGHGFPCARRTPADASYIDAPGGHVRVWYSNSKEYWAEQDRAAAPRIAQEAAHIWDTFAALMGRTPPSDKHECWNGGGPRYDVYLDYYSGGRGATGIYKGYGKSGGPAFTSFSTGAGDPPNRWELAHELFHAFQFSYKYAVSPDQYSNFDEGSANWGANYVYPKDDFEHDWNVLLRGPQWNPLALEDYGAWPFDLFLTELYGDHEIPDIYQAFTKKAPWKAIDGVIPGGLDTQWPKFTRYGWNQEPVSGGFRAWDRFDAVPEGGGTGPLKPIDLAIGGLTDRTMNLPFAMSPLTRQYMPLHVADSNIRELIFTNTAAGLRHAEVQAFLKLADGTWHTQDWSKRSSVDLCRTQADQDVTDLVIMYGNSTYQPIKWPAPQLKPGTQPTLKLRSSCDKYLKVTGVGGSYDMTYSSVEPGPNCALESHDHYDLSGAQSTTQGPDGEFADDGGTIDVPMHKSGPMVGTVRCPNAPLDNRDCSRTLDEDGSYWLDVVHTAGDAVATLKFHALQQPYNDCYATVKDGGETTGVTHPTIDVSVPWSSLIGTQPFTVSGQGTFTDQTHTVVRTYSLTLQRVDAHGFPLT